MLPNNILHAARTGALWGTRTDPVGSPLIWLSYVFAWAVRYGTDLL